jgi:DNA-binding NtrC family response regulator
MDRLQSKDFRNTPGRRILVIGGGTDASDATERYLRYCGHEVSLTKDSQRAMTEADRLKPQVLVCDVNPKSGNDRVRAAKKIQEAHNSALVIITNYHRMEVRQRYPDLEVADFLRKPISLRVLADAVSKVAAPA